MHKCAYIHLVISVQLHITKGAKVNIRDTITL